MQVRSTDAANKCGDDYEPVVHSDEHTDESNRERNIGEEREQGAQPSYYQRSNPWACESLAYLGERAAGYRWPRPVTPRGVEETGKGQNKRLNRGEDRKEYSDRNDNVASGTDDRLDDVGKGRLCTQELSKIGSRKDHSGQRQNLEENGYCGRDHHPTAYLLRLALGLLGEGYSDLVPTVRKETGRHGRKD